ncbi:pyroglutamylated RF-amide peptide receptor-like [Mya arenaria]|uniref:pyroglutamylated RF-amide peptide receptor-like n=1 Tax=Mya arenaria TaxID=6604 RepID=UPI0022E0361E|nr:pyroglutamylated RF-amide peptide receptor-like [Mya arenaria]
MSLEMEPDTVFISSAVTFSNETGTNITTLTSPEQMPPMMPPQPPTDPLLEFKKYALIITNIIGILGNFLVFYVFTRTKLKRPSTSRYLAATAIADSGYLMTVMLVSMTQHNNMRIQNRVGMCQLVQFGQHAFPFLIRWYLTAVVVDKYIGVMWPRKKSKMCTVFRAKCVIISLAIMAIVCYLYVTWFFVSYDIEPPVCSINWADKRVKDSWTILTRMDAIVNFVFPYIIMFSLTCLIAYRSWQYHQHSMSAGERFLRRRRVTTPEDKEFKTTPLLILLVSFSLLLCIPNSTSRLRELSSSDFRPQITETTLMINGLFFYFEVLNSAIRIFIYILASNSFTRQLGKILFCTHRCKKKKSDNRELQSCHQTSIDGNTSNVKTVGTSTEGIV